MFRYDGLFIDIDTWHDRLVIEQIIQSGHYFDTILWEFYDHAGCAPHFLITFISEITGVSPYFLIRYIIPLIMALFPVMYYILFKRILNDYRTTGIAIILFTLTSEFIWVNLRGEFLITPLLILLVYFLISFSKDKKLVYLAIFTVILFVANYSHISYYCIIVIPVITTVSIYFFLKKNLIKWELIYIYIILILIPLIYYNIFPTTSLRDYVSFFKMISYFIDLGFMIEYGNLLILFVCSIMVILFSILTVIIHIFLRLMHKYFEKTTRKLLFIGVLVAIIIFGFFFLILIGYNPFNTPSFRNIIYSYSNFVIFFLFYSYIILIFFFALIYFFKSFKSGIYKNWALVITAVLLIIIVASNFDVSIDLPITLDFTIVIRVIFFLSFPLCILASFFILTILKRNLKKIYIGFIIFLIIFTSYFSLAKATLDSDILFNEKIITSKYEEDAVHYFLDGLEYPTVVWVEYKYQTLIEAFATFEIYLLIKRKIDLNILLEYSYNLTYILDYYKDGFGVNESFIFIPNYLDLSNLTSQLLGFCVLYYLHPDGMILVYS
ncbi:MAG: hypothetical protein ACFFD2_12430 [Promethearchaeota archaeon]